MNILRFASPATRENSPVTYKYALHLHSFLSAETLVVLNRLLLNDLNNVRFFQSPSYCSREVLIETTHPPKTFGRRLSPQSKKFIESFDYLGQSLHNNLRPQDYRPDLSPS